MELFVVGAGRLGTSLAGALTAAGHRCVLAPGRDWRGTLPSLLARTSPGSAVLLAVSDPAVPELASGIAALAGIDRSLAVVHLSGSLPLTILAAASGAGHPVGSLHPFQSFPVVRPPEAFVGSVIAVAASTVELEGRLTDLAADLGGRPRPVPDGERGLYHASAVLGGNLLVALADLAAGVLAEAGWTREDALAAVIPLMRGVLQTIETVGSSDALIGPIRRGDPGTVRRNLDALWGGGLAEAGDVYRVLGRSALRLALEAGLEPRQGELVGEALIGAPAATDGASG